MKLLIKYGFTVENHPCAHMTLTYNRVMQQMTVNQRILCHKLQCLEVGDPLSPDLPFVLRKGKINEHVLAYMRVIRVSDDGDWKNMELRY